MVVMLAQWKHTPKGVPTTIQQEDNGSLNTSDVDIGMWLKALTLIKGVIVRQCILHLFSEDDQWISLIDAMQMNYWNQAVVTCATQSRLHMSLEPNLHWNPNEGHSHLARQIHQVVIYPSSMLGRVH